MSELSLQHLVKIYPFVKVGGTVFGRKRMKELLERQRSQPFALRFMYSVQPQAYYLTVLTRQRDNIRYCRNSG